MNRINVKTETENRNINSKFVPKMKNFKVSVSYEGLTTSGKTQSLKSLKRQYAR
ncbi:hypothetical protein VIM7927_03846 [Vibrio mangrovi]|uniref:Uncharacterized protein n=1 Tax=Vibrio mangrovi TaxID=474394 RepID=A0A1Y6J2G7_9VIBR|nr:hypothetical protein VIM7927_03846 [Vibrio mangrovi]